MSTLQLTGSAPLLDPGGVLSWGPDKIDLSELEWACPYDVVALAVICSRLQENGENPNIVLPADASCRAQLGASGLAEIVPGPWGQAAGNTDPLLRLHRLKSAEDWDFLVHDLWSEVHDRVDDPDLVLPMFDILSELIDNAATHGASPIGTFVAAQSHGPGGPLPAGLWIAVGDGGRGIPDHLRLNPLYKDVAEDERLIQLARRPLVTGTRDQRGWGLVEVFEEASALGISEALIRSGAGEGYFRLRAELPPFARYRRLRPRIPGTWVHLRLAGS